MESHNTLQPHTRVTPPLHIPSPHRMQTGVNDTGVNDIVLSSMIQLVWSAWLVIYSHLMIHT